MKNLKVIMADYRISITELSEVTGISRNTLTGYAQNENKHISKEYLFKIADYFNVSTDELLGRKSYTTK